MTNHPMDPNLSEAQRSDLHESELDGSDLDGQGPHEGVPHLAKLSLYQFRNYPELELSFSPGYTILAGANAQGKTNIIEAIHWLATTRLLRGIRDSEAIHWGTDRTKVGIELMPTGTTLEIELVAGQRKRALLNRQSLPRASDLIGRLPCISITTEDLALSRGEPSDRRLFLDLTLSEIYPAYLRHLTAYKRALDQRNALLKEFQTVKPDLVRFTPWEIQCSEHGIRIREFRKQFIEKLQMSSAEAAGRIGNGEELNLKYINKDGATSVLEFAEAYSANREVDLKRGSTSVGPHRDDMEVKVGQKEVRLYGSQGQQRTAALSIKLGSLKVLTEILTKSPLLLLDDMLSDLDEHRRSALTEYVLEHAGQAILTCTEASAAGKNILARAEIFNIQNANVTKA